MADEIALVSHLYTLSSRRELFQKGETQKTGRKYTAHAALKNDYSSTVWPHSQLGSWAAVDLAATAAIRPAAVTSAACSLTPLLAWHGT